MVDNFVVRKLVANGMAEWATDEKNAVEAPKPKAKVTKIEVEKPKAEKSKSKK